MSVKSFGVVLTQRDADIIEWLNMLQNAGQKPRKWIQAVLIAQEFGLPLHAGSVYVPPNRLSPSKNYSWTTKGDNNEFVVGEVVNITISRPAIRAMVDDLKKHRVKISPFVKMAIRQHITELQIGPSMPPDEQAAENVLDFYSWRPLSPGYLEELFPVSSTHRRPKTSRAMKAKAPEIPQTEFFVEHNEPVGQKNQERQNGRRDAQNGGREERKFRDEGRSGQPEFRVVENEAQEERKREPERGGEQPKQVEKKKNPLLEYIGKE